ncbi:MAG: hypothetical protein EZS28_037540, partial [Streblomastix strix]
MGKSTKTRANCSKMAEPNGSESSSDEGPKRACSPLKDKIGQYGYGDGDAAILSLTQSSSSQDVTRPVDMSKYKVIEDDFMEEQGCKVYWNELTGQVHIFRRGKFLAIAKEDGIFQAHTDVRLDADFWDFESKEDMALWKAAILAEAAVARAENLKSKVRQVHSQLATEQQSTSSSSQDNPVAPMRPVKRKRESEARQEQLENQASASLQDQFNAERRRVAKFNTIEDMKVAQDIRATFEGIMKVDAEKADMLNYHLNPIQREKLFEEIAWGSANVIFPVPKVEPVLPEEKRGLARSALESAVAVNQGVASL